MKPAPRLTIEPMTSNPAREWAHDLAAFSSIILALGGFALLLIARAAPIITQ